MDPVQAVFTILVGLIFGSASVALVLLNLLVIAILVMVIMYFLLALVLEHFKKNQPKENDRETLNFML
jgi:hypothetical protein